MSAGPATGSRVVHDQERGLGVSLQLADERMIDLRGQQMIQHVHGGGEQDALIRLTRFPSEDAARKVLPTLGCRSARDW